MFLDDILDKQPVDALKPDRFEGKRCGHGIGRVVHIVEPDDDQHAMAGASYEVEPGAHDDCACAFGTDERTRDIEPAFRHQLV
jgi:hypothetical protein